MFHVEARTFGRQKQEEWMKSCSMKVNFRIYFQLLCFKFKVLTTLRESVSHSVVSDSFATPLLRVHQAPLSMEFSRQEYWSGLPFPSPGDLPDSGIKLRSLALQADSLLSKPSGGPSLREEQLNKCQAPNPSLLTGTRIFNHTSLSAKFRKHEETNGKREKQS